MFKLAIQRRSLDFLLQPCEKWPRRVCVQKASEFYCERRFSVGKFNRHHPLYRSRKATRIILLEPVIFYELQSAARAEKKRFYVGWSETSALTKARKHISSFFTMPHKSLEKYIIILLPRLHLPQLKHSLPSADVCSLAYYYCHQTYRIDPSGKSDAQEKRHHIKIQHRKPAPDDKRSEADCDARWKYYCCCCF